MVRLASPDDRSLRAERGASRPRRVEPAFSQLHAHHAERRWLARGGLRQGHGGTRAWRGDSTPRIDLGGAVLAALRGGAAALARRDGALCGASPAVSALR